MSWSATISILTILGLAWARPAYARKTNEPVYQDPFDLGAGGASLTRASRDGRLFSNPALLPYGGKFHRWIGTTFSVLANKESVGTAREMVTNASGGGDTASKGEEGAANEEFIDKVFQDPVRVGWGLSVSWVTAYFGLSVFSRFEPDFRAREFGESGFPEVQFQADSYHGVALGAAMRTPFRWLTFGLTGKYLYAAEPNVSVELTDEEAIADMQSQTLAQDLTTHNKGFGVDAGMLMFFQGSTLDFSLAGKVDDLGNTKLLGPSETPSEFKQVVSAGTGLTLHTGADAIHMAVDYRDVTNAYDEDLFKKVYVGTKVLVRTYLGLGAGYYHGSPSYGAELDLLLLRIAGTYYTKELGDSPGVDPRRIYMISVSTGF